MINAGKMRHRATIEVPVRIAGVEGQSVVNWATLREVYCQIQPVYSPTDYDGNWRGRKSGQEMNFAGRTRAIATHLITTRAQPEFILPPMRMVEKILKQNLPARRVWNIESVDLIENIVNELRIHAKEIFGEEDDSAAGYTVVTNDDGTTCTTDSGDYMAVLN